MNDLRTDLNLLNVFDAVMTERNVRRAAERLSLTQPAVSNALARLRHVTKDQLFDKVRDGVRPTPKAVELWEGMRDALQTIRTTLRPQPFVPATSRLTLRVAMSDYAAMLLMVPLVRWLAIEAPGVNLHVLPNTNVNAPELLEKGQLDFAVGVFSPTAPRLKTQALLTDHYVCIMRKGHPLSRGKFTLEKFVRARHLLVSLTGDATGLVDETLKTMGTSRRVAVTVNQSLLAPALVAQSDLVCTTTYRNAMRSHVSDELHQVRLPFEQQHSTVSLMWHERSDRSTAHTWLRQQLAKIAATA